MSDKAFHALNTDSSGFSPDTFSVPEEILYPRITVGEPLLPSPYIIRLYRKTDQAVSQALAEFVEQLDTQDLIEGEEEAELAVFDQQGLEIRSDEVSSQLLDEEAVIDASPVVAAIKPPRQIIVERQVDYVSAHIVPPVEDVYEDILTRLHNGPVVTSVDYPTLPDSSTRQKSSPFKAAVAFAALALVVALPVQGFQAIARARQDGEAGLDKGKSALYAFLR